MKVLVVGGNEETAHTVALIFKVRWPDLRMVHCAEVANGADGVEKECPDLVMLCPDSLAPQWIDLIAEIHSSSHVPLVVLGQGSDVVDRVRALELGADDWVTRSCLPMEFIAKVNAILRRCGQRGDGEQRVSPSGDGRFKIDHSSRKVYVRGICVKLTRIEHKILCQLMRKPGTVVSRQELMDRVWGSPYDSDPDFLKKYIRRLRCKIEEDASHPRVILNERGVGYVFAAPGE
ncbi:MAG: winged helix-turn-helix domain-containing protein [Chloroflexota bacterium]